VTGLIREQRHCGDVPLVRFVAEGKNKTWKHKPGTGIVVHAKHGDGTSIKIRPTGELKDGDVVNMDEFDSQWTTTYYPSLFVLVEDLEEPEAEEDTPAEE
jgi:hypothetical protein